MRLRELGRHALPGPPRSSYHSSCRPLRFVALKPPSWHIAMPFGESGNLPICPARGLLHQPLGHCLGRPVPDLVARRYGAAHARQLPRWIRENKSPAAFAQQGRSECCPSLTWGGLQDSFRSVRLGRVPVHFFRLQEFVFAAGGLDRIEFGEARQRGLARHTACASKLPIGAP